MHILLSPLGFGLLLAAILLLTWRRLPRALRWVGALLELLVVLLCCPVGANMLVWQIESRVPAQQSCAEPAPDTIVVLSGGLERAPFDANDFAALDADSVVRLLAGVALWKRTPAATFVLAGGGPFSIHESQVLANMAEQLGVPAGQIRREEHSQTTWANAEELARLQPALPKKIWLVSSAMHLPRAQIAFRAAGFDACLYVSDRDYMAPEGLGYYLPQSSALLKSETAIHEMVGTLLYLWFARSSNSA
jgi:uncharacterized SAM-binding protein YcdF (DUF218 family)